MSHHLIVSGTRWLTHAEISSGVLNAITLGTPRHIVGMIRPWNQRPGW